MKSILGKLWLGITSLVLLILLIIWLFQVGLLNTFYTRERTNILLAEGTKIASLMSTAGDDKTVSQKVMDEIASFIASVNARIFIIDAENNILFAGTQGIHTKNDLPHENGSFKKSLAVFLNDAEIQSNILKGETFVMQKRHPRMKESFIIVGVPFKKDGKLLGNVLLHTPLAPVRETISLLQKQLSVITLVSLIIGSLLALLFAKLFTRPVLKMIETAKKIATGDFTARVPSTPKDEIGILGDTINDMAVQLGQIEKFRKEFIANVSHELKTPISLIRAYAELVTDMDDAKADRDAHLQVIIDEAERLNGITEDILYLSQTEAGYAKPNIIKMPILETINSVVKKLSLLATKKNIAIDVEIDDKDTPIYADQDKMYQVFLNLITNAINHSGENGHITLSVANRNDRIRIEIIDRGKGIPKEDLPYIWDRFYKVDKSRKRDAGGTGLGMAIVKNILKAHHFEYGIESEINKGTTVWIEIKR